VGVVGWLRNRTTLLMFWATAARKNLFPHELQSAQAQATQSDLILEFANMASTFFRSRCTLANSGVFANSLPSGFVHMDGRKRTPPLVHCVFAHTHRNFCGSRWRHRCGFACSCHHSSVVPGRRAIAIAFGLIQELLGTERAVCLACAHLDCVLDPVGSSFIA
jgi:hypothetical protein